MNPHLTSAQRTEHWTFINIYTKVFLPTLPHSWTTSLPDGHKENVWKIVGKKKSIRCWFVSSAFPAHSPPASCSASGRSPAWRCRWSWRPCLRHLAAAGADGCWHPAFSDPTKRLLPVSHFFFFLFGPFFARFSLSPTLRWSLSSLQHDLCRGEKSRTCIIDAGSVENGGGLSCAGTQHYHRLFIDSPDAVFQSAPCDFTHLTTSLGFYSLQEFSSTHYCDGVKWSALGLLLHPQDFDTHTGKMSSLINSQYFA